jgi:enoyl-CoA hydratase/carnithine racemase
MAYETILYEVKDNIAYVTMNRPDVLNAANQKMHEERADAWIQAKEDPEVRVVILTGAGRAFSSGADLRDMAAGSRDLPLVERRRSRDLDSQNLVNLDKPVIAAVNGYCLGNGLETALRCDIRIAAEDARFGTYEIRVGTLPSGGAHYRLTQLVGVGKAMEIILTANPVEAQEALRIGLVNQVVPPDQLMDAASTMAKVIASRAPVAIRLAKEAIKRGIGLSEEQALRIESDLGNLVSTTEDAKEGPRAFAEKRDPVWKGR